MVEKRASKRQQELLSFVDGFIKGNGYGPSYREIMRALDYKSVSTVAVHVEGLIAKGYLSRKDNSARSLEVVSLRPSADTGPKKFAQEPTLDEQLIERINTAHLNDEQKSTVAAAFELIGMKRVSSEVNASINTKNVS